jgi:hypothetical protein
VYPDERAAAAAVEQAVINYLADPEAAVLGPEDASAALELAFSSVGGLSSTLDAVKAMAITLFKLSRVSQACEHEANRHRDLVSVLATKQRQYKQAHSSMLDASQSEFSNIAATRESAASRVQPSVRAPLAQPVIHSHHVVHTATHACINQFYSELQQLTELTSRMERLAVQFPPEDPGTPMIQSQLRSVPPEVCVCEAGLKCPRTACLASTNPPTSLQVLSGAGRDQPSRPHRSWCLAAPSHQPAHISICNLYRPLENAR